MCSAFINRYNTKIGGIISMEKKYKCKWSDDGFKRICEAAERGRKTQTENCRRKYEQSPKFCLNCKKLIPYEKRINDFCNSSCAAIYNNNKKIKKEYQKCLNCGVPVKSKNNIYCDNKCHNEYERKIYIEKWKLGLENGIMSEYGISQYIRKYLHEKYNSACCQCGYDKINPFSNKSVLEIEHIDGNSKNNNEYNLLLLCPNCHSLTSTYKGLNKGNGRHSRRIRYKEGKSY